MRYESRCPIPFKLGSFLPIPLEMGTANFLDKLEEFVISSEGLLLQRTEDLSDDHLQIVQNLDRRALTLDGSMILEILERLDSDGKLFLQVNLLHGKKLLLTPNLIGFKPLAIPGLDLSRLPKVVTTPDLQSVEEAISDALANETPPFHEIEILKKVYDSVMRGGEMVGFSLVEERSWFERVSTIARIAVA